jgi:hypothetical protein
MPEIYTKDNNGNFKSLGNVDPGKLVNTSVLGKYIKDFWTDKKSGKHPELGKKHYQILQTDLIAKPEDLFEQLKQNKFVFQDFGPLKIVNFLKNAKLDSYLKPEYVEHCLEVTTHQPAIGKGEFLLVSCFNNINFSDKSGDLVDDEGNKIEVKGTHSAIGGPKHFKQMNKSIMFSIYNLFGTNPDFPDLTMECAEDLQTKLIDNPQQIRKTMLLLQNNNQESNSLAEAMTALFNEKQDLLNIVAAAHLYAYLKLQKANFLFAINDKYFAGFATPKDLKQSYEIIKNHFKVNGWTTGNSGITFTLRAG